MLCKSLFRSPFQSFWLNRSDSRLVALFLWMNQDQSHRRLFSFRCAVIVQLYKVVIPIYNWLNFRSCKNHPQSLPPYFLQRFNSISQKIVWNTGADYICDYCMLSLTSTVRTESNPRLRQRHKFCQSLHYPSHCKDLTFSVWVCCFSSLRFLLLWLKNFNREISPFLTIVSLF